jgi:hypothetical protein
MNGKKRKKVDIIENEKKMKSEGAHLDGFM